MTAEWRDVTVAVLSLIGIALTLYVRRDVKDLHLIVNSRLSELLDQKGRASHAEGVLAGTAAAQEAEAGRKLLPVEQPPQ